MVGKVRGSHDIRSVDTQFRWGFSNGQGDVVRVDGAALTRLADHMAKHAHVKIADLDESTRKDYQTLTQTIKNLEAHPDAYTRAHRTVTKAFASISHVEEGTVGYALYGCTLYNGKGSCGNHECSPMCISGTLKHPDYLNKSCDNSVVRITEDGQLIVDHQPRGSNRANVYLASKTVTISDNHIRQLKSAGIVFGKFYVIGQTGCECLNKDNNYASIDSFVVGNRTGFFGSMSWWWWALIVLAVIIALVLAIIAICLAARKYRKKETLLIAQ